MARGDRVDAVELDARPRPSASAITAPISSTWARLAISGTTPPNRAWRSIWLDTTDESHDAAVLDDRGGGLVARRLDPEDAHHLRLAASLERSVSPGDGALDRVEQLGVVGLVDLVRPHHERVLVDLLVVVLAHADRPEAEASVQLLRAEVRHADLEREAVAHRARSPRVRAPASDASRSGGGATSGRPRSS